MKDQGRIIEMVTYDDGRIWVRWENGTGLLLRDTGGVSEKLKAQMEAERVARNQGFVVVGRFCGLEYFVRLDPKTGARWVEDCHGRRYSSVAGVEEVKP